MITRRQFTALPLLPLAARQACRYRYEIREARVPFHERVREVWLSSWRNQKRDQSDYLLTFVTLHTDTGASGLCESKLPRVKTEALLKDMIGKPISNYVHDDSIRGLLIAVYISPSSRRTHLQVPLPSARPKVIPTWWSQCFPPAVMASEAKLGASLGYRVHKVKARPWEDPDRPGRCDLRGYSQRDQGVGGPNSTWATVDKTISVTKELSRFSNYFAIESPFAKENRDGYRALKGKLPLKLAEHVDAFAASGELDEWIKEGLLHAWIVGAPKLGRYTQQLAAKSRAAHAPIWIEHSIDNGIDQVFQAHQSAAYPEIEYVIAVTHVLDDCMKEPFTVRDGYYHIPNKPGLGVSLDLDALDRYHVAA